MITRVSATIARVKPVGDFGLARLDDLVSALEPVLTDPPAQRVVLDLRELTFIGPTCLSLLVAACCEPASGTITKVRPPKWEVRNYLDRMNVFDMIPCEAEVDRVGRRTTEGFRECQRFASLADCEAGAPEMVKAISERCKMDKTSRTALEFCLEELAENVVFHAGSGEGGFAAVQSWPKRQRMEIGIVDLGRGIRRSLVENPDHDHLLTDVDAIRCAMELGVTATPERNSGQGLFFTERLLEQNGGHVLIRSGSGYVYAGGRIASGEAETSFPGTAVALTINTARPLDAGAISRLIGELKGDDEDPDDLFD